MEKFKILAFAGSLREKSFNRAILRMAKDIAPEQLQIIIIDLNHLPLYNDDLAKNNVPDVILKFREEIAAADGLLIASPEHNYSISGVLKTALDWATTFSIGNLLDEKITAVFGASKGNYGTARSQLHLRQVLHAANVRVLERPEVYIRNAGSLMDSAGNLHDSETIDRIRKLLIALLDKFKYK